MSDTHALRRRCPRCRRLRRFYEPPGGQGGERPSRAKWVKVDGAWICRYCTAAQPEEATT